MKPTPGGWVVLACVISAVAAMAAPTRARGDARPPSRLPKAAPASAIMPSDSSPSPVVFPPERLALEMDHRRHAALGMGCAYCHERAERSTESSDRLLPTANTCDACHESDHSNLDRVGGNGDACSTCHVDHTPEAGNQVARSVLESPRLTFDHRVHAVRGVPCARCHTDVERVAEATRDHLPRMRGCLECHGPNPSGPTQGAEEKSCTECHPSERGRMRTRFGDDRLTPPPWLRQADHSPDWLERHKLVAANDSAFCANCHAESECVDCHDGRVRPRRIHPGDFLSMHSIAARQTGTGCNSCHRAQSFCQSCHQRSGVTMTGPTGARAGRGRFHPPRDVWTDGAPTLAHHGREARRNISACVSCHQERDCVICHGTRAVGALGASPHGPNFSSRCRSALQRNPRPCWTCHQPSDPNLASCR